MGKHLICLFVLFISLSGIYSKCVKRKGGGFQYVTAKPDAPTLVPLPGKGEKCYCVPYDMCEDNQRKTDRNSYHAVEIAPYNDHCRHYLDVCCGGTVKAEAPEHVLPAYIPANLFARPVMSSNGLPYFQWDEKNDDL